MAYKKFDTNTQIFTQSQQIDIYPNCNAILFTNLGDTTVTVDEKTLFPSATPATVQGDAVAYGGNEGEVYNKQIAKISFTQPVGANPRIEVVQKFYV